VVEPARTVLAADAEVHVPLLIVSGTPLVEWTDAEGTTRRFMVDTGANAVILSPEVVMAARLPTRDNASTAGDTASGTGPIGRARDVRVNGLGMGRRVGACAGGGSGEGACLGFAAGADDRYEDAAEFISAKAGADRGGAGDRAASHSSADRCSRRSSG